MVTAPKHSFATQAGAHNKQTTRGSDLARNTPIAKVKLIRLSNQGHQRAVDSAAESFGMWQINNNSPRVTGL